MVLVIKDLPANAGDIRDTGSIPGSGRSPGEGYGNSLQYSCPENSMDREVWRATVHWVTKSRTLVCMHLNAQKFYSLLYQLYCTVPGSSPSRIQGNPQDEQCQQERDIVRQSSGAKSEVYFCPSPLYP